MASRALPSPEVLRQLLRYEPDTGKLFWLERPPSAFVGSAKATAEMQARRWNTRNSGKEAFTFVNAQGYMRGGIFGVLHLAHRVIWAIEHGSWPPNQIDHINGDGLDNRLANLRAATSSENCMNRKPPSTNTSGVKGVSWHRAHGVWHARIKVSGKNKHIGYFADLHLAAEAYAAASNEIHGQYGRLR